MDVFSPKGQPGGNKQVSLNEFSSPDARAEADPVESSSLATETVTTSLS